MNTSNDTLEMSLGSFRDALSRVKPTLLVRDEPLEPLSISIPVDSVNVILGCSSYVALKCGTGSVTLSHIQTIKPSVKGGTKSFRIICNDYSASNVPVAVEYRLFVQE